MKGLTKLAFMVCILVLLLALTGTAKVHALEDQMETFFDSQLPYIGIQVNATAQTQPTSNLTVIVDLETQADVGVENFNLEVSGFLNGTTKLSMLNITGNDFFLNYTSAEFINSTYVPNWVWGTTFGEITMTYNVTAPGEISTFPNVVTGFPMTQVENTYLENLETQNQKLTNLSQNLNNTLEQLNRTYVELLQNYNSVKGNVANLDNAQRVATVLAVTTIIFLVTTVYLVMRRPKESW